MTRDPLDEFFAAERDDVRELSPEPGHWESLLAQSRHQPRRGWLPYVAVAAGAAVIGGALAAGALHQGRPDGVTAATSTTSVSATRSMPSTTVATTAAPATTTGAPVTSSPPVTTTSSGPLPAPASFDLVSMTNAGGGHLYALGAATCPQGPCTSVVASDDDGRSWVARSTFEDLVPTAPRSTPDGSHQVVGVRFATPEIGYVFGSDVRRTADGGRTWQRVDVDRRVVLSLETDGSRVWMATARSCTHVGAQRGCTDLQPRTASVRDLSTSAVPVDGMPARGENAWIALDAADAYYNVTLPDSGGPAPAMRLSGTPAVLPVPEGCADGMWVTTTANTRRALLAVCRDASTPKDHYALAVSTDAGARWTTRQAPDLGTPAGPGPWLTATDTSHVIAIGEGQPTTSGAASGGTTLLASADGGAHWATPKGTGAALSSAPDWAGAAGGRLVYVVGGGASYWASRDAGESFTAVPLRR